MTIAVNNVCVYYDHFVIEAGGAIYWNQESNQEAWFVSHTQKAQNFAQRTLYFNLVIKTELLSII